MATTGFYVDGFNLYHAISDLGRNDLKWLNLKQLAKSYLQQQDVLVRVCYFTAVHLHNPEKAQRHQIYIDALRAVGVEVITSTFQRVDKYCKGYERYCKFSEEKRTDVALASTYLVDAMSGLAERIIIVTADSDQIPCVTAVQVHCPLVSIELAPPPGRAAQARELASIFTKKPKEISEGRLAGCLFPRNVTNDAGRVVARCPAAYVPIA
jgi:uncharacterized LabA/DUF88 family protein